MSPELLRIPADGAYVEGLLELPSDARGLVLLVHGSECSRHSPRYQHLAQVLHAQGSGTLRLDLLTLAESLDYRTRFDIALLTHRLLVSTRFVLLHTPPSRHLPLGYFGDGDGAAVVLQAAAALGHTVQAVVSNDGRTDLAGHHDLTRVDAPTLILVGEADEKILENNRKARTMLHCENELATIPGAAFTADSGLDEVGRKSAAWYARHWH